MQTTEKEQHSWSWCLRKLASWRTAAIAANIQAAVLVRLQASYLGLCWAASKIFIAASSVVVLAPGLALPNMYKIFEANIDPEAFYQALSQ